VVEIIWLHILQSAHGACAILKCEHQNAVSILPLHFRQSLWLLRLFLPILVFLAHFTFDSLLLKSQLLLS
jgi:hypothetical protein